MTTENWDQTSTWDVGKMLPLRKSEMSSLNRKNVFPWHFNFIAEHRAEEQSLCENGEMRKNAWIFQGKGSLSQFPFNHEYIGPRYFATYTNISMLMEWFVSEPELGQRQNETPHPRVGVCVTNGVMARGIRVSNGHWDLIDPTRGPVWQIMRRYSDSQ